MFKIIEYKLRGGKVLGCSSGIVCATLGSVCGGEDELVFSSLTFQKQGALRSSRVMIPVRRP